MAGLQLITCIVERGKGMIVVDTALACGAQAATFFNAYGKGIRERMGEAGRNINPEKDVVFVVTEAEQTQDVFEAIVIAAQLKEPGKGFAYVSPVGHAVGIIQSNKDDKNDDYQVKMP